ncbi:MAG: tripartite tricarboxylate transporter substrate binding protein BugD [Burkholderiaceae bacterium]|nr:tripartite tricarboxylate transporter substrate binding protein BugD [Burkholderiaceae bacterium]
MSVSSAGWVLRLAACWALCCCALAWAEFPEHPITLVVPFPAGGPTDKLAHDLARLMSKSLGKPLMVEPQGGSGGVVGTTRVAHAVPDGYTLLLHHFGIAATPSLYPDLKYRPLDDFEYLGMVTEVPMLVLGRRGLPPSTPAELLKWIHAHSGPISLANSGRGSASHLCGMLLQQAFRRGMVSVPYKGSAPALAELEADQVDLLCDQTVSTLGPIESGRIKAYAATTPQRVQLASLNALPTLQELGFKGFSLSAWAGLYAPRGTPRAIVEKLNAALQMALKDPEFRRSQEAVGALIIHDDRLTPVGHKRFVSGEIDRWAGVVRQAGAFAE